MRKERWTVKKQRVNPNRRPATVADVQRAKRDAQDEAIKMTWSIFFTVMRDKEGYGVKRLQRLWGEVNELSDSIAKGYVNVTDLRKALMEEAGINLV
jgi:hypothetical protein